MGIDPALADFTDVQSELLCPICHGVIIEPVELPCGHPTCSLCMNKWMMEHSCCPLCNLPTQDLPRPISRLLLRILERVTTKCDNYQLGCNAILNSASVAEHKKVCIYRLEVCDNPNCMKPVRFCRMASHRLRCVGIGDVMSPYEHMCVDCKLLQRLGYTANHCSTIFED